MPGDDLLFQRLSVSTIGAVRFHGRVRDGIGWGTDAMVTRQWSLRMSLIDAYQRMPLRPCRSDVWLEDRPSNDALFHEAFPCAELSLMVGLSGTLQSNTLLGARLSMNRVIRTG